MRILYIFCILLFVNGCVSSNIKNLCTSSGYIEKTPAYESCISRNSYYADEIGYCQRHYSIYREGDELNKCMEEARQMKSAYKHDYYICRTEAMREYPNDMTRPIPPTTKYKYNAAGQLIESYVLTQEDVPEAELNSSRNAIGKSCMSKKGWNSYSSYGWNGQKQVK
jgi:hypothetical protein